MHLLCSFGIVFERIILTFCMPPVMVLLLVRSRLRYPGIAMISQEFATTKPREFLVNVPRRVGAIGGKFGFFAKIHGRDKVMYASPSDMQLESILFA